MYELISIKQLSSLMNVSTASINRWRKKGLPFKKIEKAVRYDLNEVKQWIEGKQKRKEGV